MQVEDIFWRSVAARTGPAALPCKLRMPLRVVAKARAVYYVPMEHVQLGSIHPVQRLQQRRHWDEVSTRIHHHATPGKRRCIVDSQRHHLRNVRLQRRVPSQQLRQRGHTVRRPLRPTRYNDDGGRRYGQRVGAPRQSRRRAVHADGPHSWQCTPPPWLEGTRSSRTARGRGLSAGTRLASSSGGWTAQSTTPPPPCQPLRSRWRRASVARSLRRRRSVWQRCR